ncbi:hypothetical protein COU78_02460 [Candidatus Peregrinibacteria bacterium CG10_big_fil_rev_8_21_14_0_10_49_24]|nr:MAG: hypothetical protein COV83_02440 [Candidatus Peregrinibacteria bacterium CG11_big_fil_rev_8_21_14_0_20_49_14]PIR51000.1 MAG: hypothetical protein COU78_02460 [Candidatus Peregrinibacteria bacterium CG10_big_fil_rev_8_21_14_0_10_49_24]PJA67553.1 MAG: hypothetical protein CO157_03940 [Candidatus Peregrinibacteria bacterium CG_4_9_14_3_um_filter_49_12]
MESVSQERIRDICEHIVARGEGSTSVSYEHWEWEEAGQMIYDECKRIRAQLETLTGSLIRVVIENGNTAMEKELHFFREEDGGSRDVLDTVGPSPVQNRRRAGKYAMHTVIAA